MRARIAHRGPDEGSSTAVGDAVLGSQRLCVIDPERGFQPVANETGDVVAVFNGELYNFRELREDLAARGHDVRGYGDTPVLPHLYEEYGVEFVERLEGMFAFALFDRSRGRLVLARDRLGKKPLVWTRLAHGTFAFASELKAFATCPASAPSPTWQRSTPTSRSSTSRGPAQACAASTGSRRPPSSSSKAMPRPSVSIGNRVSSTSR
ncbi:MAG: hypothetical protein ABUS54_07760 [Actinomycetota bacterium]